jgi:hypothetical protein
MKVRKHGALGLTTHAEALSCSTNCEVAPDLFLPVAFIIGITAYYLNMRNYYIDVT